MVEVTLLMTNDELREMIYKIMDKLGKFSPDDEKLYKKYFDDLIDEGHGTLFYGPVNLTSWVKETLDRLTVISSWDNEYEEVKRLWENQEYENSKYCVVCKLNNTYLIEEY